METALLDPSTQIGDRGLLGVIRDRRRLSYGVGLDRLHAPPPTEDSFDDRLLRGPVQAARVQNDGRSLLTAAPSAARRWFVVGLVRSVSHPLTHVDDQDRLRLPKTSTLSAGDHEANWSGAATNLSWQD
jgi:hypothetical protein